MNKTLKIITAIIGACSVLIEIITPFAVAFVFFNNFELNGLVTSIIFVVSGFASLFRAIKIGWWNKDE